MLWNSLFKSAIPSALTRNSPRSSHARRPTCRPSLEVLEDRLALSTYNINFTASSETYSGYVNDTGKVYGSNGSGLTFGWNTDMSGAARDRNAANSPDERYDSLIHVGSSTWSIAVPNGTYTVHVVVGDPSYADVVSKLMVNGVLTLNGSTSNSQHWLEGTTTATVTNGLITVSEQAGSYDKIDYIDITSTGGPVIPAAPTGLTTTAGNAQVSLSWAASAGVATYNIYRSTSSGGEGSTAYRTGITATSFTDTGLTNGTTYFYQVTAVNSAGESGKSSEVSASPTGAVVSTGTGLTGQYFNDMTLTNLVLTRTDPTVNFSWGSGSPDPSIPVDHFSARWSGQVQAQFTQTYTFYTESDDGVRLWVNGAQVINNWTDHAPTENSATIALVAGQKYDIKMEYYENGGGALAQLLWSSPSTTKQGIPTSQLYVVAGTAPAAPTGLTASAGNAQALLTWMASPGATSYNIYRSTTAGGEGTTAYRTGITSTSFTDTALTNGTRYYYQVTAVNSFGESSKSSEVSAAPLAPSLPAPWVDADIGSPGMAGSGSYLAGTFTLKGGGADIWNTSDQFNFVYQPFNGDGAIIARVGTEQNTNAWAKAGVMIRESLAANATDVFEAVTPGNGYAFQYRTATGASASWPGASIAGTAPEWVKLVRAGNVFTGYVSADGSNWTQAGSLTISMASNVYVGLALTAHDNTQLNISTFDNVSVTVVTVTIPAAPTNVAASAGNAQVSLTWTGSGGATSYNIYRSTTAGGEGSTPHKTGVTTTSYTDTGLPNGTKYYYQVSAVNGAGESARSSEASATPLASGSSYSTNFPLTENPISEGGVWARGGTEGLDWTNPLTTGGHAVASTTPTPTRYSDDIAIIKSSAVAFSANQYAQGTVYLAPGYTGNGGGHEVELLLHFSISAHDAHGYEILWGIPGYMAVVRWNGPVTSYAPIYDPGVGSIPVPKDGDVLRAEISGNIIKVFRNGTQVGPNIDVGSVGGTVWSTGQPGMGFWPVDGAIPGNYGWKSYQAGSLSPEMLAGTPLTISHAPSLTQHRLDRTVAEAIRLWAATGLSSTQVSALQHVQFVLTDLPGGRLGQEGGGTIEIDSDAAGYGWSLGPVVAPHKIDLLTVVSHELGHELGLPDLGTQSNPGNLMDDTLAPGLRRLPELAKEIDWKW